jgi:hypothetical protein
MFRGLFARAERPTQGPRARSGGLRPASPNPASRSPPLCESVPDQGQEDIGAVRDAEGAFGDRSVRFRRPVDQPGQKRSQQIDDVEGKRDPDQRRDAAKGFCDVFPVQLAGPIDPSAPAHRPQSERNLRFSNARDKRVLDPPPQRPTFAGKGAYLQRQIAAPWPLGTIGGSRDEASRSVSRIFC